AKTALLALDKNAVDGIVRKLVQAYLATVEIIV
ncbi:MAG: hypothetical protein ACI9TZ_001926, partial [Yoonia sp.]